MITNGKKNIKKILLTGGCTGGSVMPLLAIFDELTKEQLGHRMSHLDIRCPSYKFLWNGTKNGVEREMIGKEKIEFKPIVSGKFRRYFSWKNFIDPFYVLTGFIQSLFIINKWKPDLVISAGSFVSVPVVWAAWIWRASVLIHQQDIRPGLANKLMAPFAKIITTTFAESVKDYGPKTVWTGNPIRQNLITRKQENKKTRKQSNGLLAVLIIGGGTGAGAINKLVERSLDELTKFCRIIHVTGKNKNNKPVILKRSEESRGLEVNNIVNNYNSFEFLNTQDLAAAYAAADVVVSRCGMGVLSELAYFKKPSILIPIPNSHQEDNAAYFYHKNAAVVLDQNELTPPVFIKKIKELLADKEKQKELSENIGRIIKRGANKNIIKIIKEIF